MSGRTQTAYGIAIAVGFFISVLHGVYFILGGVMSNLAYAIPLMLIAIHFLRSGMIIISERLIIYSLLMAILFVVAVYVSFGFQRAEVANWQEGALYYGRGLIILVIATYAMQQMHAFGFITGLFWGGSVVMIFLAAMSFSSEYLGTMPVKNLLPAATTVREYSGYTGLYNNPNYWSIYSVFVAILCGFFIVKQSKVAGYSFARYMGVCVFIFAIGSTIFTGSRMGIIACIIVMIALLVFGYKVRSPLTFILAAVLITTILVVIASFISSPVESLQAKYSAIDSVSIDKAWHRFLRLADNVQEEDRFGRMMVYFDFWSKDISSIIFGIGLRTTLPVGLPHNTFVSVLMDFGVIGFSAFILFLLTNSLRILQLPSESDRVHRFLYFTILSVFTVFLISNDIIESRASWVMLGILVSARDCFLSFEPRFSRESLR